MTADENHRRFKFVLFEISVQKTLESLSVTSLVAGHFVYGVVDGV